ncbi:uncharacterized protein MONBRDRAFT_37759 [Monosiga brevicollis MX1]|uniref:Phospholipid/glycerol acyltransferase domain-containing protein n=1 Tax=Monosiga brevicollis TaxID=81824 RepID=A9V3V5_MONBE|nr:uncharacterized protein MONBRDRAFT_37759 [Monosiga brevicollis MX1]EDQ87872.1 predicted protein [Monosiga brevicollis MX1]|eukprot:XP_001747405.1 hypothetical protein [Monosiga brevicollis MX1]
MGKTLMDTVRYAHGVLFMVPATLALWFLITFALTPVVPFLVFKPTHFMYMAVFIRIMDYWLPFVCLSLEWFAGVRVHSTVDEDTILKSEPALFISNHPTHLDWHPIFCLAERFNQGIFMRILLKDELRKIPIFGVGWQLALYIFLKRTDKAADMHWIKTMIEQWKQSDDPGSFLIFPEGTDMASRNVERSHQFSREHNLPTYNYIIHPRTAGTVAILQHARTHLKAVYDITMGFQYYRADERPREKSYLTGRFPPAVHMHIKRYPIEELPQSDEDAAQWIKDRFAEKETMLKAAYNGLDRRHEPLQLPGKPLPWYQELAMQLRFIASIVATLFVILAFGPMLCNWWALIYAIVVTAAWHYIGATIGIDRLLVKYTLDEDQMSAERKEQ